MQIPFIPDKKIERILQKGVDFNILMHEKYENIKNLDNLLAFSIVMLESLIWADYAVDEEHFIDAGIDFFFENDKDIISEIKNNYSGRYGGDKLINSLESYQIILYKFEKKINKTDFSKIDEIELLQKDIENFVVIEKQFKSLQDIGAWLTYAPFKILLLANKRLWEQEGINKIKMPVGIEVERAIKKLKKNFPIFADKYLKNLNFLGFKKNDFQDYFAQASELHHISLNIINDYKLLKINVLHVNSALYEYGASKDK